MPDSLSLVKSKAFKTHGDKYNYLDITYAKGKTTLTIECPVHGVFTQNYSNHLNGRGCKKCSFEKLGRKEQHTLESVKQARKDTDYEYLGLTYGEGTPKLTMSCPRHGEFKQDLYNHLSGKGCIECFRQNQRLGFKEAVSKSVALHGDKYKYLDIKHQPTRLVMQCRVHGLFTQLSNTHLSGHGCDRCANEQNGLKARWTKEELAARGVEAEEVYFKNGNTYATMVCEKHGKFDRQAHRLVMRITDYPYCSRSMSKSSKELVDYIASLGYEVVREFKFPNSGFRWDAVIHSKNLAVEFHGLYWHSEEYRPNNYHAIKHELALANGYRTIHIFEHEWASKSSIVKGLLADALGVKSETLGARKTLAKEISHSLASSFLEQHHIQGATSSSKYLGLYSSGKLVAVMGYACRASGRGMRKDTSVAEITRYASSIKVVGGFAKLLKMLKLQIPELKQLYTFSDTRLFTGNLYALHGFKVVAKLKPDYFYIKGGRYYHKANMKKSAFRTRPGLTFEEGKTEYELAKMNGLHRVFDCGKVKWVKEL
jgi:hypothetical protein